MLQPGAGRSHLRLHLPGEGHHHPSRGLPERAFPAPEPGRFTEVEWDGGATKSFRVQIAVDSWDRPRLLEDVARTFAEHGANIVEYSGHVDDQMAKNWYVARSVTCGRSALLGSLRNIESVFDAYRVTPS